MTINHMRLRYHGLWTIKNPIFGKGLGHNLKVAAMLIWLEDHMAHTHNNRECSVFKHSNHLRVMA